MTGRDQADPVDPADPAAGVAEPARPGARPVPGRRLPAALFGARMAARSAPSGAGTIGQSPHTGTIEQIAACKRALLVTYRRDGTAVPTPVWAASDGGRLYVRSERSSGKVKRLRNDARLLVAPCTVRGQPLGAPLEARARVLPRAQEPLAERALALRYGFGRELFERAMDLLRVDMCFLEITPVPWRPPG
ncbi:MAG TPA: PPOX class F420-dependent oxidoreductase [Solirubrobacteraceae bacterium]|jgi:PPOX class probable F420-dependent enzyme|nr:PPOX class F420-dependent oxidoreductase [Solirubrobacteraceae bacterium]